MSTNDKSDAWLLYFRYGYRFFKPTDRRDRLFVLATLMFFCVEYGNAIRDNLV